MVNMFKTILITSRDRINVLEIRNKKEFLESIVEDVDISKIL